jgi:hypothetical protein
MRGLIGSLGRALAWTVGALLWIVGVMAGALLPFIGTQHGEVVPGVLGGGLLLAAVTVALVLNDRGKARADRRAAEEARQAAVDIEAAVTRDFPAAGVPFRIGRRAIFGLLAIFAFALGCVFVLRAPASVVGLVLVGGGVLLVSPMLALGLPRFLPGFPALVVGPEGIDDVLGAGLIEWRDITSANLSLGVPTRHGLVALPGLDLGVRNADRYRARISRLLNLGRLGFERDSLRIPLCMSAARADDALAAIRHFHAPSIPAHHLVAYGTGYIIDAKLGTAAAELERAKALFDATVAEGEALKARGIVNEDHPEYRAWLARSEARLAEARGPAGGDLLGKPPPAPVAQLRVSPAWRFVARAIVLVAVVGYLLAVAAVALSVSSPR